MTLGDRIKALRLSRGYTLEELGDLVGVGKSTVRKWETGDIQNMRRSSIARLAQALGVSPLYIMGLSEERTEEPVPPAARPDAAPVMPRAREIDPIYDALNADGQKELCRYGRYLGTREEYQADEGDAPLLYIKHYLVPAAAGYASPIEGEDYEEIPLPADAPANADYCITIQGDSMEPYIPDGSIVYVKRGEPIREFDVGIFFVDGDVFCKQWCPGYAGETYLLSANPKRRDANIVLPRSSGRTCLCFGKVLLNKRLPQPDYL